MAVMLEYARRVPSVPVVRPINVTPLAVARRQSVASVSWSAIFIRAYGIVCSHFPELRRAWISWPFPYLYEHPHSDAAVAVERQWGSEKVVLMGLIRKPESASLRQIHNHLHHYQSADIWSVSSYRATLRLGRLPTWLQRLVLWNKLDVSGKRRVKYSGTFGMSNYGMLGAESLHPIGPQTTIMTLSPIRPDGEVKVKLVYDHRVLDGSTIARSLAHLDEVLHDVILAEIHQDKGQAA
jgi:hypothetical protein